MTTSYRFEIGKEPVPDISRLEDEKNFQMNLTQEQFEGIYAALLALNMLGPLARIRLWAEVPPGSGTYWRRSPREIYRYTPKSYIANHYAIEEGFPASEILEEGKATRPLRRYMYYLQGIAGDDILYDSDTLEFLQGVLTGLGWFQMRPEIIIKYLWDNEVLSGVA